MINKIDFIYYGVFLFILDGKWGIYMVVFSIFVIFVNFFYVFFFGFYKGIRKNGIRVVLNSGVFLYFVLKCLL